MSYFCPKKWLSFFKAIHNRRRSAILEIVRRYGRVNASKIVEEMGLSQPTISHHLKILYEAGLVEAEKKGKEVIYTINKECISECCGGFMDKFSRED